MYMGLMSNRYCPIGTAYLSELALLELAHGPEELREVRAAVFACGHHEEFGDF